MNYFVTQNRYQAFPKQALVLMCLKTLSEKEKLLVTSIFPFPTVFFNPFEELTTVLIQFKVDDCKPFSVWKSLKFIVWERVNPLLHRYSF